MKEQVKVKHDGGHYEWVIVVLVDEKLGLKTRAAESVGKHYAPGSNTHDDEHRTVAIKKAVGKARHRAQVAMTALKEAQATW